jgi:hypothetical protein
MMIMKFGVGSAAMDTQGTASQYLPHVRELLAG